MKQFDKNIQHWNKAKNIIPGGCSTNAKSPDRLFPGISPLYCAEASGAYFKDIDGNTWLDCDMGMGTVIWGHARQEINEEVIKQLQKGTSFSIGAESEMQLAELILNRLGHYSSIRFGKNGTDVVSAAVRISRAVTGKEKVAYATYHGWMDWSAYGHYGRNSSELGIPDSIKGQILWLEKEMLTEQTRAVLHGEVHNIASVVVCPGNWTKQDLEELKTFCQKNGVILVFDEVSSGMRWGKKGAAGVYDVWPDLLCLSKGLANGLPLSVLVGETDLMEITKKIKFSTAHASECLSLSAAIASEKMLLQHVSWPIWKQGAQNIVESAKDAIAGCGLENLLTISGNYGGFRIHTLNKTIHNDPFRNFLVPRLAENGIFTTGYILLSAKHTDKDFEDIEKNIIDIIHSWKC